MIRLIPLLLLAACSQTPDQPRLQTYGAFNPVCLLFCRSSSSSADLEGSAQQHITETSTATGGDKTGG